MSPIHMLTPDARYHVKRRTRLFDRIGWLCADCGRSAYRPSDLHADHIHGDRMGRNTKQELSRLLALSDADLRATVQPLCPACHEAKTLANGDARWASER